MNPHRYNATLQKLNLSNNRIGEVGAAAIGEGLRCVRYDYAGCFCRSNWCGRQHLIIVLDRCNGVESVKPHRHNAALRELDLSGNSMSASARKSVELELVLCQMRNAAVTTIHASDKGFDDADASRIAHALRCACGFESK